MKAHKVVLSACSSVFKNILIRNPHQHPLIYLSGVRHQELKGLINFMYLGQAEVSQEHLEGFMNLAQRFQVKGLCQEARSKYEVAGVGGLYTGNKSIINSEDNYEMKGIVETSISESTTDTKEINIREVNYDYREDYIENSSIVADFPNKSYRVKAEYNCEKCDYKTKQRSHLVSHTKAMHEGIKFPCDKCDYKAGYNHHLNLHKRRKHSI